MRIFKNILGAFCVIRMIIGTFLLFNGELNALLDIFLFALFSFLLFRNTKRDKQTYQNSLNTAYINHINGLTLTKNEACTLISLPDKFQIKSQTLNYDLDKTKITDVCIKMNSDIEEQHTYYLGDGSVNYNTSFYLIITYKSNGENTIIFDISNSTAMASARKFVSDFKMENNSEVISL